MEEKSETSVKTDDVVTVREVKVLKSKVDLEEIRDARNKKRVAIQEAEEKRRSMKRISEAGLEEKMKRVSKEETDEKAKEDGEGEKEGEKKDKTKKKKEVEAERSANIKLHPELARRLFVLME